MNMKINEIKMFLSEEREHTIMTSWWRNDFKVLQNFHWNGIIILQAVCSFFTTGRKIVVIFISERVISSCKI